MLLDKEKENAQIELQYRDNGASLIIDGEEAYTQDDMVTIVHKPRVEGTIHLGMTAFMKSPIFTFLDESDYSIYAIENGERKSLTFSCRSTATIKQKLLQIRFLHFIVLAILPQTAKLNSGGDINGHTYKSHYWFMPYSGLSTRFVNNINRGSYMIKDRKKYISVKPATQSKIDFSAFKKHFALCDSSENLLTSSKIDKLQKESPHLALL